MLGDDNKAACHVNDLKGSLSTHIRGSSSVHLPSEGGLQRRKCRWVCRGYSAH